MTIEASARALIGTPWRHQGRDPQLGLDCIGTPLFALRENGYVVRDRADYGKDPNGTLRGELTRVLGDPIAEGPGAGALVQPGDIVTMLYPHTERHVGIVSQDRFGLTLIHADNRQGKVVEHGIDTRWRRRIVGVWRPG